MSAPILQLPATTKARLLEGIIKVDETLFTCLEKENRALSWNI